MTNSVFVYGSLKADGSLQGLARMADTKLMAKTRTTYPNFNMFDLGPFPAVQFNGSSHISGEIWEITDSVLDTLDVIEGYPEFYNRQIIETEDGPAWIYYIADTDSLKTKQVVPDSTNTLYWSKQQ